MVDALEKQTEAVEALIQELPKFRLKAVPDDCGECLICLEELHIGHEVLNISFPNIVRGLTNFLCISFATILYLPAFIP